MARTWPAVGAAGRRRIMPVAPSGEAAVGGQSLFESLFERDLARGERIVWTGRARTRAACSAQQTTFWRRSASCGVALRCTGRRQSLGLTGGPLAPPVFAVFGVPFVILGLYFIFGRFVYQRWAKQNTYYALTNPAGVDRAALAWPVS